jgi:glycosyltransferase involved in cell wall biosynthesis
MKIKRMKIMSDSIKFPKVSVGIPTRNSNGNIEGAILSVVSQHYPNIEIIISDDDSTDNTEALCVEMSREYPFIRYIRQKENIGLFENFDFVLKESTGEYFMWLSDDDAFEPGIIQVYVDFLQKHPDYELVSGQVLYWDDKHSLFYEKDFNMEQRSRFARVVNYYFKVIHGAIYYGMMRRKTAVLVPQRSRIGDDWHFVAALSYLGKVKNLDQVGYNKKLGGTSRTFKDYALAIGASSFDASFPRVRIAMDAFTEILFHSPIYSRSSWPGRAGLALAASAAVLTSFYVKEYPFIVGGRIKRFVKKLFNQEKLETSKG